jgi:TctA family transporter
METLAALLQGFAIAITPANLAWAALGVTLGTAVGVLPGIGPSTTVALLLPFTFALDPGSAFIMFAGIVEMTVISHALGGEIAFAVACQLVRNLSVSALAPILFDLVRHRGGRSA